MTDSDGAAERERSAKTYEALKAYGLFALVALGAMALLVAVALPSEGRRARSLGEKAQAVLDARGFESWKIIGSESAGAPLSFGADVFRATDGGKGGGFVVAARVQTIYGPFPAVFVYDSAGGARFAGMMCLDGRVARAIGDGADSKRINFWKSRVPAIVAEARRKEEG